MRPTPGSALLAVLAVALVAAVGILVAGGERRTSIAVAAADPVLGAWHGTTTSSHDGGAVDVRLAIDTLDGFADGRLAEATDTWSCAGSLAFARRDGDALVFRYTEEESTGCIASTVVTVRPLAGGGLAFSDAAVDSAGTEFVIAGELRPRG